MMAYNKCSLFATAGVAVNDRLCACVRVWMRVCPADNPSRDFSLACWLTRSPSVAVSEQRSVNLKPKSESVTFCATHYGKQNAV